MSVKTGKVSHGKMQDDHTYCENHYVTSIYETNQVVAKGLIHADNRNIYHSHIIDESGNVTVTVNGSYIDEIVTGENERWYSPFVTGSSEGL